MAGSSKWSHWLETTELRKKRSTSSNQSLQNSVSEHGQPWSSKYTVSLHSPDTSLGTRPNKVAGDCVLSLSMWGQYGLIRVYDFKISCDAVGFITWLHEKRIIWDILIKQLSEQKEKKCGATRSNPICRQQPAPIQKEPVIDEVFQSTWERRGSCDTLNISSAWRGSHSVGFWSDASVEM